MVSGRPISLSGSTDKTRSFLNSMKSQNLYSSLNAIAQQGVAALSAATPVDSGLTASSWSAEVEVKGGRTTITWSNSHVEDGVNIAVILQYGHGTGTGGYVAGRDYINGALKPIFDAIANDVWRKVTTS